MRCSTDTCAGCRDFNLAESLKSGGFAECQRWGRKEYSDKACVLHMPAKDREQRKQFVIQLSSEREDK